MRILAFVLAAGFLSSSGSFAAPTITRILPPPGSTNHALSAIEVFFSEPVTNVDASDLLINAAPATALEFGVPGQFLFQFPPSATGVVQVAFANNHGITDLNEPPQPFAGGSWSYVVDPNAPTAALLLNEFMADNERTLNDEDGHSEDWIEIHNPGSIEVGIGGWFLTDDPARLDKWQFPEGKTIPANGYLVVFASNKDRTNVAGRLHTNFQLSDEGEYLALVDRNTNVVSDFPMPVPRQETDVSYGRVAGAPTLKGFFTTPTPGTVNQSGGPGFAPEVNFSRPSGTFIQGESFGLILSTPLSNAVIYYADGTNMPGSNTTLYTGPVTVSNTRMIRARAFAPGLLPGPVTTRSYIALAPNVVNFNSHFPIIILHNYGQGALSTDKSDRYVIAQAFEPEFGKSSMTNMPSQAEFGRFHLRGSSTVGYQKGSFFLELWDEFRNDKEVPLAGMPEESDWVLYAPNNFEPALFHNPLAFRLARDLGEYASRTRFVEVYLKDDTGAPGSITTNDYNGVYVLQEKIKRDNNRVDITPLERENVAQPEVSGGYMWSIDRGDAGEPNLGGLGGAVWNWVDPNGFEMTNAARLAQRVYVTNYFNAFNTTLASDTTWTNPVTGYEAYIDVDSWVRRHIHEVVTHNIDALRLSGFFFKDRGKRIEYGPAWDYDRTQGSTDGRDLQPRVFRSRVPDLGTDYFNFSPWWNRLFRSPDFWQRWIDKYQELREGPFAMTNISARIEQFAAEIRPVHGREVARWNIRPRTGNVAAPSPESFSYNFGPTQDYENEVRWKHFWYSNRLDFIDTNFLRRPTLSGPGGAVTNGYRLTVSPATKPGSSLFYTLDGTDPRLPSGGILPTAFSNNGPVELTITSNVHLFARSWNRGHSNVVGANNPPISSPWSGKRQATLYTHIPALRITEIMYHPQDALLNYTNDVNFEYVEVKNVGETPLNLNRFSISGGIDFEFPNITLDPGQAGVIVANQAEFINRYGSERLILGQYANDFFREKTNVLDNAGERLVLSGPMREPILDFEYDDEWYPITDGYGFSLVVVDEQAPTTNWVLKTHWRPSGVVDGSPSENDPPQPAFPLVVISEVLTHTDPAPPFDSIELQNLSSSTEAQIGGWFLTDEIGQPYKFRIPDGTVLQPGEFIVFDEEDFNTGATAFSLSSLGDEVYLFSADPVTEYLTGYYHGFDFGPAQNGRSFGRHIISTGTDQFPPQMASTLGSSNAGPLIGPIIISEINYRPFDTIRNGFTNDNSLDEYIELMNVTSTNVPLYDLSHPGNTWELNEGVDYSFPPGVMLPPGGSLLVVNFNPTNVAVAAVFRARNYVPETVPLYGPYEGKLDNSGEPIELRRPDRPEPPGPPNFGLVPSLLVERVRYSDKSPWPTNADGRGLTLQRISIDSYGNDPASWVGASGTPGAPHIVGPNPQILAQPTNVATYVTYDAAFSVQASGGNVRYQWLFNGIHMLNETNGTLVVPYVEEDDAGFYSVLVLTSGGLLESAVAELSILPHAARILAQPQNATVATGNGFTNRATIATTGPVTYQWFHDGVEIPGANATNYPIASVQVPDGGVYTLRITDDATSASIFTRPVTLRVVIQPFFVQRLVTQTVPQGSTVVLSVAITNTATMPITNRWRRNSANLITNVHNSLTDFYVYTNVQGVTRWEVIAFNEASPNGIRSLPEVLITAVADADLDGIPDTWESYYGVTDPAGDADDDKMSNLAEYIAGTDPTNNVSYLKVEKLAVGPGATVEFNAVSNRTYTVEATDALNTGIWTAVGDVYATSNNRPVAVFDPAFTTNRFYRLATPKKQ